MNKITVSLLSITFAVLLGCGGDTTSKDSTANGGQTPATETKKTELAQGDYCFLSASNKDTTIVKLRVLSNDDIRGEMIWRPWEKDGAVGNLAGKMNAAGELELLYDYTIEGSRQTEAKVMKIENDKLMIKEGELVDAKNDGNLTFKDVSKAEYKETLAKTTCK